MHHGLILIKSEPARLRRQRSLVSHWGCKNIRRMLDATEGALPQEVEVRPAESNSFLQFQAVDLRFHLSVIPLRGERRFDSGIIVANPFRHF